MYSKEAGESRSFLAFLNIKLTWLLPEHRCGLVDKEWPSGIHLSSLWWPRSLVFVCGEGYDMVSVRVLVATGVYLAHTTSWNQYVSICMYAFALCTSIHTYMHKYIEVNETTFWLHIHTVCYIKIAICKMYVCSINISHLLSIYYISCNCLYIVIWWTLLFCVP